MKRILLVLFLIQSLSAQSGIRSLNGSLLGSQRLTISYDDTATNFRWSLSDGVHTLYIPYGLNPSQVGSTGNPDSLGGYPASAYFRKADTTYLHALKLHNKLDDSDTTSTIANQWRLGAYVLKTYLADSLLLYAKLAGENTFTGRNTFTKLLTADSLTVSHIHPKTSSAGVSIHNANHVDVATFGVGSAGSTNIALLGNTSITGNITNATWLGNSIDTTYTNAVSKIVSASSNLTATKNAKDYTLTLNPVLAGLSDSLLLYAKLAGTQTFTGVNTFQNLTTVDSLSINGIVKQGGATSNGTSTHYLKSLSTGLYISKMFNQFNRERFSVDTAGNAVLSRSLTLGTISGVGTGLLFTSNAYMDTINPNSVTQIKISASLKINGTTGDNTLVQIENSVGAKEAQLSLSNTGTSDGSISRFLAIVPSGATGNSDPFIDFLVTGGGRYVVGIDNSDNDKFGIWESSNPGTSPLLTIASGGVVTLTNDLAVNGDDITSDGDLTITPAGGDVALIGLSTLDSLRVKGARYEGIDTTSLSRTITTETTLLCNNTTNISITLPALSLAYNSATKTGRVIFIKKGLNNSATVTIVGTIDGYTNITTDVYNASYELQAHQSGWIIR